MTEKNSTNEQTSTSTPGSDACDPVAQALEKLRLAVKEIVRGATAGRAEAS